MEKPLYVIYKRIQSHDSDCWQHWIRTESIAYYMNKDSANKACDKLNEGVKFKYYTGTKDSDHEMLLENFIEQESVEID